MQTLVEDGHVVRRSQRLMNKKTPEKAVEPALKPSKLVRKNAVTLCPPTEYEDFTNGVSFDDYVVYGVFKYEMGDKKAHLAKKRLNGFLKLALLFFVIRAAFIFFGILKPATVPSTP